MVKQFPEAAERKSSGLACVGLALGVFGCEDAPSDRYPEPWIDGASPGITRVLNSHSIQNCANIAYRPSNISEGPLDPQGEFLVYCSADGANWTAWVVFPARAADRDLIGPAAIYEDIPPP